MHCDANNLWPHGKFQDYLVDCSCCLERPSQQSGLRFRDVPRKDEYCRSWYAVYECDRAEDVRDIRKLFNYAQVSLDYHNNEVCTLGRRQFISATAMDAFRKTGTRSLDIQGGRSALSRRFTLCLLIAWFGKLVRRNPSPTVSPFPISASVSCGQERHGCDNSTQPSSSVVAEFRSPLVSVWLS